MKDYDLNPELIRTCGVVQAIINLGTIVPKLSPAGRDYTRRWIESYLETLMTERKVGKNRLTDNEIQQLTQIGIAILSMLNHKEP